MRGGFLRDDITRALIVSGLSVSATPTDTFTDAPATALTAHTADTNQPWVTHPSATGTHVISNANRARCATTIAVDYLDAPPSTAEYDVTADIAVQTAFGSQSGAVALLARVDPVAETYYRAEYSTSADAWRIIKTVSGTQTTLAASPQFAATDGQTQSVRFVVRDAFKSIEVGGVEICRTTDNAITAAGFAGIRSQQATTDTTGMHYDNFSVVAATASSKFGFDDFTGTDGTDPTTHNANWIAAASNVAGAVLESNTLRGVGVAVYCWNVAPASPDYDVSALVIPRTDNNSSAAKVLGRADPNAASLAAYALRYDCAGDVVRLDRFAGAGTQLGTSFSLPFASLPAVITLRMRGNQISGLVNGVTVIGPITDNTYAAAGLAGVRFTGVGGVGIGVALDDWTATNS